MIRPMSTALALASSTSLADLTVGDAMHEGVVSCTPETPLRSVARMLSGYRIHALVVLPRHQGDLSHVVSWAVVSDVDVARAARSGDLDGRTAWDAAATPVCCIGPEAPLDRAIDLMVAERLSHLIVVEGTTGRPLGVLSTLDVARAIA